MLAAGVVRIGGFDDEEKTTFQVDYSKKVIAVNDASKSHYFNWPLDGYWIYCVYQYLFSFKYLFRRAGFGLSGFKFIVSFICHICVAGCGDCQSDDYFWMAAN